MVKYIFRLPNDSSCNNPCQVVFTHSSPIVNERRGFFQLWVTKALEIREVQSKVWTSPNWTSWQRSNREGLAPLTKKQYSGTWTLDKGATERVCAAEWLRRLSEGFGQGGADRAENLLTRFFWQCELSDCWELNYSKQSPGNHRIPFKQTAESGDQQKTGGWKTSSSFEIWAWLGSWMMSPF